MKNLNDLLHLLNVKELIGKKDISVTGFHFNSAKIEQGNLFVAIKGTVSDGHAYITDAIQKGATAVLCEDIPSSKSDNLTYIQVENCQAALAQIASTYYNNPSEQLALVGVTGTNGKTTTATLLYNLFKNMDYKVGLISTIAYYINDTQVEATHTTPDTITLNRLLNQMVEEGCEYCFMEVSSHAIDQKRIAGLSFRGGIFSNITHDHLDYHKTFAEYLKVKKSFFDHLDKNAFALSNVDDKNGEIMLQNTKAKKYTYALRSMADYKCRILESHIDGMKMELDGTELWSRYTGVFNAYNILSVYAAALLLEEDKMDVLTAISALPPVSGRFESIHSDGGITAIVDYAHTPDALQNVLNAVNDIRNKSKQLITVVGAGGNRDKSKRPLMAEVAVKNSTKLILTSDNPRNEDPITILSEMQEGISNQHLHLTLTIADRREAIKTACMLATEGDIILVAGKGHESYQEINGVRHHFDDKEVIKESFNIFKK